MKEKLLIKGLLSESDFYEYEEARIFFKELKNEFSCSITLYKTDQMITLKGIEDFLAAILDTFEAGEYTRKDVEIMTSNTHMITGDMVYSEMAEQLILGNFPKVLEPFTDLEFKLKWAK